jgi:hypothetical protein
VDISVLRNEKDISIIHIILQMILNFTSCQVVVLSIYPKPLSGLEVSMKLVGWVDNDQNSGKPKR